MRKISTILCLLLAVAMCLSGCDNQETTDTVDSTSDYVFNTSVESFEDMTLTFGAWWNIAWPEEPRNDAEAPVVNALNALCSTKNLNIDYVKIAYENYYRTIIDSIENGDPVADLFWIESDHLQYFLDRELLIPYSYSTELDLTENKWDEFCTMNSIQYGYVYGVYWGKSIPGYVLYCNSEYVDMDVVENAISEGTWNWETLVNMVISMGEVGAKGFGGDFLDAVLATNNADITDIIKANDHAEKMLEYIRRMAAADAIYDDPNLFFDGEAAFYVGKASETWELDSKYQMVTLPMGPDATDYISMTTDYMVLVMAKNASKSYSNIETALNLYTDIMWEYSADTYTSSQHKDITEFFSAAGTKVHRQKVTGYEQAINPFMSVLLEGETSAADLLQMFRLEFSKYPVPDNTTDPSQEITGGVG